MRRTDGRDIERDYLSIREVLELLVEEFPEITISKIRFLESRGLIHPERTPSGYRKFYEGDVTRLRWILRQQRENFLPLKVIKGRLDGDTSSEPPTPEPSLFDEPFADLDRELEPLVSVGASLSRHHEAIGASHTNPAPSRPEKTSPPGRSESSATTANRRSESESVPVEPKTPPAPEARTTVEADEPTPPEQRAPAPPAPPAAATTRAADLSELSATSFTREELVGATGASIELVNELVAFGFFASKDIAGEPCFDERALVLTRVAAGFANFGIEPRHLRSLKHAAERDGTLFGQVVVPLLRQRNPEARERARRDLDELVSLGTTLHRTLLESELRPLMGG